HIIVRAGFGRPQSNPARTNVQSRAFGREAPASPAQIYEQKSVRLSLMAGNAGIAFVANTSLSIYKIKLYLIEQLLQEGFTIYVRAPRDGYTEKFAGRQGLPYIELRHFRAKSISPLQDYLLYRELYHHYRTLKPGLVFHYTVKANLYGTRAAARAGIPS